MRNYYGQNYNNFYREPLGRRIKRFFTDPSPLNRLILINTCVYLAILLLRAFVLVFSFLFQRPVDINHILTQFLAVPADLTSIMYRPWTLFTSIFLHLNFGHIFFNMLMLYFCGIIFLQHFREKDLYRVYIYGGILGNLLFILSYNVFPVFREVLPIATALGASGGILAVLIASATKAPHQKMSLLFIGGNFDFLWLALIFVFIDLISIPRGNPGGHIAHLGGALFGFLFVMFSQWRQKLRWRPNFSFRVKKHRKDSFKRSKTDEEYNRERADNRKRIDEILDKVAKTGYKNLTEEEKNFLFRSSQKQTNW